MEGQGEKRRTDVSARVTNPIFTSNTFNLPLPHDRIELNMRILFAAFVVADREDAADSGRGQARLLGECILELGPLAPSLTDVKGAGVRQHLRFIRNHEGETVTVGRFLVTLRLIGSEEAIQLTDGPGVDIFHPLPAQDPFFDFMWRARVDLRASIDVKLNYATQSGLPSPYLEFGWSYYLERKPAENEMVKTMVIPNNRHPIWNQQILYPNPSQMQELAGYFWLFLKDRMAMDSLDSIIMPLQGLRPFHPIHIEFLGQDGGLEQQQSCHSFISIAIEEQVSQNMLDYLVDIAVIGANWDPIPSTTAHIMVAMTTHGYRLTELPFRQVDLLRDGGIENEMMRHKAERQSVFLSPIMPMHPRSTDNPYGAQAIFTVPKSFLDNQVSFYLIVRDESLLGNTIHPFPNSIAGHTDLLDDDLQTSLHASNDKTLYVPVIWDTNVPMHRVLGQTKATLQIQVHGLDERNKQQQESSRIEEKSFRQMSQTLMGTRIGTRGKGELGDDRGRWDVMSRELQQKQELIHRLMKENDEKSDALKLTGSEVVELRRLIKLLQNENAVLRKRLKEDDSEDVENLVSREIETMNNEDLKMKIIKISHLYRNERLRNEEFEKMIQSAQREVTEAYRYKQEVDRLREHIEKQNNKVISMTKGQDKINAYRATIKKQEQVISKLEKLLEKTVHGTKDTRYLELENERLRTENLELRSRLNKSQPINTNELANDEIRRLERLVHELREQLKSKRPISSTNQGGDWEREKMELEIQLQKAELRVQAMQDQLDSNAQKWAKEVSHYKGLVAEKQSIIDTMQMDVGNLVY